MEQHLGKQLVNMAPSPHSVNSYVYKNTHREPIFNLNVVCYSGLGRGQIPEKLYTSIRSAGTWIRANELAVFREYLDYITNRSIFSHTFLTKDFDEAWECAVEMDTTKNFSQVVASMIALRQGYEFKEGLDSWKMFKDAGVNEDLAFVASVFLRAHEVGFHLSDSGGNHHAIGYLSPSGVVELIEGGLASVRATGYQAYNVFGATRSSNYADEEGKFSDLFKIEELKKGSFGVVIRGVPFDKGIKTLLKFQKEHNL